MVGVGLVRDGGDPPPGLPPVMAQGSAEAPTDAPDIPALPRSEPVGLEIPAINIRSAVTQVGLNSDGTIEVPQPGPWVDSAAWYRYSPTPGEDGPTVIEGHIDTPDGLSVFARLPEISPGDEVLVHREDGLTVTYEVTGIQQVPKDAFPTDDVYGDLDRPGLRLITCGGGIDSASGLYRDNILVFATIVGVGPTPEGAPDVADGPVPLPVYATPTPSPTLEADSAATADPSADPSADATASPTATSSATATTSPDLEEDESASPTATLR